AHPRPPADPAPPPPRRRRVGRRAGPHWPWPPAAAPATAGRALGGPDAGPDAAHHDLARERGPARGRVASARAALGMPITTGVPGWRPRRASRQPVQIG